MAPERSSRPGGFGLPGMRNSALATAALTSVALFSQTADAVPMTADEGPSREDVRQRVSSLYDQAESDTGLHNITRAQSASSRGRGAPASGGRTRTSDPEMDDITRQWFAGARSSLGPTVPAVLPADRTPSRRTPARPAGPRPESAAAPAPETRTGRELEPAARPALELPAGQTQQGPVAELTAAPTATLPAVPAQRQDSSTAPPAAAPESKQASLRSSKQHNQRKIAAASELLYRYTARQTSVAPLMAAQSQPLQLPQLPQAPAPWEEQAFRSTEEAWRLEQPSVLDTGVPPAGDWRLQPSVLDTGVPVAEDWQMQPSVLDTGVPAAADWQMQPSVLDTGVPVVETPVGTKADRAVAFARAQIGRPCLWGAVGPESYDNAGLTQASWKAAGVALPRTPHEQANAGTVIPLAESRPGDLIFFHDNFSHVGLYTGNGLMIHAPGPGSVIREESIHNAGEAAIRIAVRPA
ncbi:NlpC/P60 family protein [Streptomyces sp. NBC_00201]|uniref:NlpC/P60 family protein n=1 Tax=unclassified Streptomyces TaxID=2593676 RepID=UPI00224E29D9|nr:MULTISPECIES: NlpC/P60 family protein [unclassified Streptomyces]MCX5059318.1 NlpC/P60 family protein [Streptomyces sp. NBC_00452]MCX5244035.1 NlpC/P60 family protein [Streptomyces sp. NBC_00201]MCX5290231.1 NlpC/P60 family protein [Streptomyces sp. NBC_00183]